MSGYIKNKDSNSTACIEELAGVNTSLNYYIQVNENYLTVGCLSE